MKKKIVNNNPPPIPLYNNIPVELFAKNKTLIFPKYVFAEDTIPSDKFVLCWNREILFCSLAFLFCLSLFHVAKSLGNVLCGLKYPNVQILGKVIWLILLLYLSSKDAPGLFFTILTVIVYSTDNATSHK